ncbi:MAG: hypothetical protein HW400_6 [Candidatus Levybacteria bacterium]|nr:hypothetical protein [Candidatus Levybacteria bacterium]
MITPLEKIRELIKKNKLDAALISSVSNIIYLTNYSGFSKEEREVYLFITKNEQYILTDGRYATAVKTLIPDFELIEISPKNSIREILKNLQAKHKLKKIGFEGHNMTHLEHKKITQALGKIFHVDLGSLRITKNPEEIYKIESACKLGDKTFDYVLKKIRLGVSEKEISNDIEFFIKGQGGDISFKPIVAFGANSTLPHHVPSNRKLKTDNIVLLDFGVKLDNYCSDMTRTIFFGKANAEFKKMYETVLKSQKLAIEKLNIPISQYPNIRASQIDKVARDYIISKGYPTIPHSLGHGIGIEVHEDPHLSPKSKDILKEGMVFSVEPGIYLPADLSTETFAKGEASARVGLPGGVRIEDLVVLEKSGPRLLTHSLRDIIEI